MIKKQKQLLGEHLPPLHVRFDLEKIFAQFSSKIFQKASSRVKFAKVCKTLLKEIESAETPCFLLPSVLAFIDKVNELHVTDEPFSLSLFETWINHFSRKTFDQILQIRGKIVGRYIPREEYQVFFPVGMGKVLPGSHVVAAHLSPDVDTTVSSFWGWLDAFGCHVSEGNHQWSLPSGLSDGHIQLFLRKIFGDSFFRLVPRELQTITLSAQDLLTKRDFFKVTQDRAVDSVDITAAEHAVVIVDEQGLYQGEWRSYDAEVIGNILTSFRGCLRWFESRCYARLIHMLAKDRPTDEYVKEAYKEPLETVIANCPVLLEISEKARKLLDSYLKDVLMLPNGILETFFSLFTHLDQKMQASFSEFLKKCSLIQRKGDADDGRKNASSVVEEAILAMGKSLDFIQTETSTFAHVLRIKEVVLNLPTTCITLKSDIDEMRSKIGNLDHLTIVVKERTGGYFPVGIVYAEDLRKTTLGTASLRDFSSLEETKMASYIEVVSILDHHKTKLTTSVPPTLVIGDAQSSNTLLAEISLSLNTKYGVDVHDTSFLLQSLRDKNLGETELQEKLIAALSVLPKRQEPFFVDINRELAEYFSYLYAILDDTDLLTKVSFRDVFAVKALLDRMRSLVEGKQMESVSFSELFIGDPDFVKKAAKLLLQSHDLHSIYVHMYQFKEEEVERAMRLLLEGRTSTFFLDTKEQNGCCRIGQAKLFCKNVPTFEKHKEEIRAVYIKECQKVHAARPHIDFYLEMTSTIPSSDEVCSPNEIVWEHEDEIWIYSPDDGVSEQHLVWFLNNFQSSQTAQKIPIRISCIGKHAEGRALLCRQNFPAAKEIVVKAKAEGPTIVVLSFPAGKINSRKAQISPYLPKLVT